MSSPVGETDTLVKDDSSLLLSVAVPRPLDGLFTYRLPAHLSSQVELGGWVKVPFGRGITHAFVVEAPKPMSELPPGLELTALKAVIEVGESGAVFTPEVLELCRWASDYYFAPLGEVLHCAAPPAALGMKSRKKEARPVEQAHARIISHELSEEQVVALEVLETLRKEGSEVRKGDVRVALLEGVTGSGKTEVYLELARRVLAEGRGVLILVPEIALTSQLHRRFEENLGVPVALWHSALADGRRRDVGAALRSGELRVAVGARSAVFAPVHNLGLIVVDEEHDPTYKQEDRVRYHARDLAIVRARGAGALVVLGSATPSLETRERVREGRYGLATLTKRVSSGGVPRVEIVDLRTEIRVEGTQAPLSQTVITALQETIDAGDQAMVFLNRRGFASFLVCQDCGDTRNCPQCSISLTVHRRSGGPKKPSQSMGGPLGEAMDAVASTGGTSNSLQRPPAGDLRCHVCGHREPIPDLCPKCQSMELVALGAGTESLELDLPKLVPGLVPLRLDRDQVTSAGRLEKILSDFRERKANTLLGTQMLVKGHDFPGVTLVVVILADALFRWPDFRAPERAHQILKQVAGRAGRGERPGKVLIQAFDVEHPVLLTVKGDLPDTVFIEGERELRKTLAYPPFGRMARLRFENSDRDTAISRAQAVAREIERVAAALGPDTVVDVLGPSEAFLERAKGIYRWDILLKSRSVQALRNCVSRARAVTAERRWPFIVDVDPSGAG